MSSTAPRKRGRPRIHPERPEREPETPAPPPPASGRANPHAPNHLQAVQLWSEICRTQQPRPMAPSSISANEVLWGAWCTWLAGQALHWSDASAETIRAFLDGPAPSLRRKHRPARNPSSMSSLTRVRYFRVLKGVYSTAKTKGWIEDVPTLEELQPEYNAQDAQGAVLPPGLLARLQNTRQLRQTFAPSTDSIRQWWLLRDRAAVALVAETGITCAELINLKLADLGAGGLNILQAMQDAGQGTLLPGTAPACDLNVDDPAIDNPCAARMPLAPVVLTVPASRTLQSRSITLSTRLCESLLPWVALRERMLTLKAATFTTLYERSAFLKLHSLQGPLFPSRQGKRPAPGQEVKNEHFLPMESASVYLVFKRAFAGLHAGQARQPRGAANVPGIHYGGAQGPSVIRNTLIQQWLREMDEEQVKLRAGFKTLEALRVIARAAGIACIAADAPDAETTDERPARRRAAESKEATSEH